MYRHRRLNIAYSLPLPSAIVVSRATSFYGYNCSTRAGGGLATIGKCRGKSSYIPRRYMGVKI